MADDRRPEVDLEPQDAKIAKDLLGDLGVSEAGG